jgi:dTDP-glucose 4,6-dehydratase
LNWDGKRVLVTGAGGFIASHLAEALVTAGAQVRALVHYNALGKQGWLDASPQRDTMEIVAGDITDADSVLDSMIDVDVVFHLAALIAIPYSYIAPGSYVRTNIIGTLNILQAARQLGTGRVIHTSTSEVYGTARYVPIDEDHPLQGQSPYSASKIGADMLVESFYRSFDVPAVTVRPFNTFGPRQSARAVIPTIILQCLQNGGEISLGKLTPTRDLNYVANTVEGFMCAAKSERAVGQVINLGSGREISIGDLAGLIASILGVEIEISTEEQRLRPQKSEVDRLLASNTRARELIAWEPCYTLEDGLEKTIQWIRENAETYQRDYSV